MNKIRKNEIENKYRTLFDNINFEKELSGYNKAIENVKFTYNTRPQPGSFGYHPGDENNPSAMMMWIHNSHCCYYSGNKNKIIDYIEKLTGETILFRASMEDKELKEFQAFIIQNEPEYLNYVNL